MTAPCIFCVVNHLAHRHPKTQFAASAFRSRLNSYSGETLGWA